jgi:membrane-bound lytic murein transglycosylase B
VRGDKRFFLVYGNYEALLKYNCANSYAVTIGLLSDQLAR